MSMMNEWTSTAVNILEMRVWKAAVYNRWTWAWTLRRVSLRKYTWWSSMTFLTILIQLIFTELFTLKSTINFFYISETEFCSSSSSSSQLTILAKEAQKRLHFLTRRVSDVGEDVPPSRTWSRVSSLVGTAASASPIDSRFWRRSSSIEVRRQVGRLDGFFPGGESLDVSADTSSQKRPSCERVHTALETVSRQTSPGFSPQRGRHKFCTAALTRVTWLVEHTFDFPY